MPIKSSHPSSSVTKLRPKAVATQLAPPVPKPAYTPTPPEAKLVAAHAERRSKNIPIPYITVAIKDGVGMTDIGHEDKMIGCLILMKALGFQTTVVLEGYLGGLMGYARDGEDGEKIDPQTLNFIIQVAASMKPKDAAEAMLCAQMAIIHSATVRFAGMSNRERRVDVKESYQRSLNKLARTYAAQMTTLKQYRSDGKQKIVVKHVTVNEGGQAIVGDVTHGGGAGGIPENDEATA